MNDSEVENKRTTLLVNYIDIALINNYDQFLCYNTFNFRSFKGVYGIKRARSIGE